MQHPLVLVNSYITLLTDNKTTIKLADLHFFEELQVYNHLEKFMTSTEGVIVSVKEEYFSHEGMIEDVAFLIESLQGLQDNAALGHIIHYIASLTQTNSIEFISQVVAKIREYTIVEQDMVEVKNRL